MKKSMPEIIYAMLSVNLQRARFLSLSNLLSKTDISDLQKEYLGVKESESALKSKPPHIFIEYLDVIHQVMYQIEKATNRYAIYINQALVMTITSFETFGNFIFSAYASAPLCG